MMQIVIIIYTMLNIYTVKQKSLGYNFLLYIIIRDENGTDIFRPYSSPNPFRGVQICPYPSPDIQHPIPYPYPNNQIAYL